MTLERRLMERDEAMGPGLRCTCTARGRAFFGLLMLVSLVLLLLMIAFQPVTAAAGPAQTKAQTERRMAI